MFDLPVYARTPPSTDEGRQWQPPGASPPTPYTASPSSPLPPGGSGRLSPGAGGSSSGDARGEVGAEPGRVVGSLAVQVELLKKQWQPWSEGMGCCPGACGFGSVWHSCLTCVSCAGAVVRVRAREEGWEFVGECVRVSERHAEIFAGNLTI